MNMVLLRHCAAALGLAGGVTGTSHALTVLELQSLLQSAPAHVVSFSELRESPWLATPMESRGTMHWKPGLLEKRVETPRQETWRMLPDRVEWAGPDGTESKQILFSQAPAVAVLADALRRVVAGDLLALEREFKIELRGDTRGWTLRLQPLGAENGRYLDHLELMGAGARLQVIIVVERQGARTTTRLDP
jgi:hypothetical protein